MSGDGSTRGPDTVLAALLPDTVRVVEARHDVPEDELFPEERRIVARAVDRRRREFATARWCARRALSRLGVPPEPILTGPRGEPVWPAGVVGSITHCTGYRAGAVALATGVATLGIDAEPNTRLPGTVVDDVAGARERAMLGELAGHRPDVCWDRLLFSAKESVYKAWYPVAGSWLGFHDAEVSIDPVGGGFVARVRRRIPNPSGPDLSRLAGRWAVTGGLLLTAVAVAAAPCGQGRPPG
jgi:4'-phosphopantetheinyl transferase EntD